MDYTVLLLVILLQLSTVFGSGDVLQTKDCGDNSVASSISSHGEELFYLNGNVVNKVGFCKALKLYIANGCDVNDYFESNHCVLDLDLDLDVSFGMVCEIVLVYDAQFFFCCNFSFVLIYFLQ